MAHGNALPPAAVEPWVSISTELVSISSTEKETLDKGGQLVVDSS